MDIECPFCDGANGRPELGKEHCASCHRILTGDRLVSEAQEMERDGLLTKEDIFHGSDTGC